MFKKGQKIKFIKSPEFKEVEVVKLIDNYDHLSNSHSFQLLCKDLNNDEEIVISANSIQELESYIKVL